MLPTIRQKIRALVSDFSQSSSEVFTYVTSAIFTIAQDNVTVTAVEINGDTSGITYTFSSTTNKITITSTLVAGDIIEVSYTYNKYSDTELDEYIRAALVWMSVYSYETTDYEIESNDLIAPTPNNKTTDLIALVASILINSDFSAYKMPNYSVVFPRTMSKELRIEKLIGKFNYGIGVCDILNFDVYIG